MSSMFTKDKELVDKVIFEWSDLHGKLLRIHTTNEFNTVSGEKTTVVFGIDENHGHLYVLHSSTKRI